MLLQEEATDPWGVHVDRVEIKDVRLPKNLQRAMAAEAEATREARAKVMLGTLRRVEMVLMMVTTRLSRRRASRSPALR